MPCPTATGIHERKGKHEHDLIIPALSSGYSDISTHEVRDQGNDQRTVIAVAWTGHGEGLNRAIGNGDEGTSQCHKHLVSI